MKSKKIYKNNKISVKNNTKKINNKNKPKLVKVNGSNLLLIPLKNCNSVKMECTIFGGNFLENKKLCGIAHLLEHIIISASKHCGKEKCDTFLDKYGILSNASTRDMYTNYWVKGLTEYSDILLNYITSIIYSPKITKKLLDDEKNAVINELESIIDNPKWKLMNALYKEFFKPFGYKNSANYKLQLDTLKNLTLSKIKNYFDKTRINECLLFTICGNFDRNKVIEHFKKQNKICNKEECVMNKITNISECYNLTKKVIFIKNPEAKNTTIYIAYPTDIKKHNKESIYLNFLWSIISGGLNSIFLKRLRLELNLVYNINIESHTNLCGTIILITTSTTNNNALKVVKEIFKLIDTYKNKNISKTLIKNNKIKHRLQLDSLCFTNPSTVSNFYNKQYFWQIHNKKKQIFTLDKTIKILNNIGQKELKIIMNKIFNNNKCIVTYGGKKNINFSINDY